MMQNLYSLYMVIALVKCVAIPGCLALTDVWLSHLFEGQRSHRWHCGGITDLFRGLQEFPQQTPQACPLL